MKHLLKFNESSSYDDRLVISAKDLEIFSRKDVNPKYPGLTFESDTHGGDFDAEKGAMCDYPVFLHNEDTGESWIWRILHCHYRRMLA